MNKTKPRYDCSKCPGYCCSYDQIEISEFDVKRLAKHLSLSPAATEKRYTKIDDGKVVLRHHADESFTSICIFFDSEKRRCTVYEARPRTCRTYPYGAKCGYYEFLKFEREHQDDEDFVATTR
ncbi:MAG: YkgJ family cysteine cluster protein [Betaproteobacteria bacterium]|nr:YkgJ family cysteine cluster protein [Betaproteobacteria bacterium]